jgi:hypothetical protein
MTDRQSPPPGPSRPGRRQARDQKSDRKRERALNEIFDLGPPGRRSLIKYKAWTWLAYAAVAAPVGALVTWAATKAIGPTVAGGLGLAILTWSVMLVKRVIYLYFVHTPIPSKAEEASSQAFWNKQKAERDEFMRAAVAGERNPSGRRPEEYPVPYRSLIGSLAEIAGEIGAAIRVVSYSGDSITIDTGPYCAGSIKRELAARAAEDGTRLTLQTRPYPTGPPSTEILVAGSADQRGGSPHPNGPHAGAGA